MAASWFVNFGPGYAMQDHDNYTLVIDGTPITPTDWTLTPVGVRGIHRVDALAFTPTTGVAFVAEVYHTANGEPSAWGEQGVARLGNVAHGGAAASLTLVASPAVGATTLAKADDLATLDEKVISAQYMIRDVGSATLATPQGWNWAVAASPSATYSETLPAGAYVTAYYVIPGATSGTPIFTIEHGALGNVLTNILAGEVYYAAGTRLWFEICPGSAANFPAGTLTVTCGNTVVGSGAATDSVFALPEVVYWDNYIALADGAVEPFGGRHVVPTTNGATINAQDVRDAMKLAPSAGAPAAGSVDLLLNQAAATIGQVATLQPGIYAGIFELSSASPDFIVTFDGIIRPSGFIQVRLTGDSTVTVGEFDDQGVWTPRNTEGYHSGVLTVYTCNHTSGTLHVEFQHRWMVPKFEHDVSLPTMPEDPNMYIEAFVKENGVLVDKYSGVAYTSPVSTTVDLTGITKMMKNLLHRR